MRKRKLKYITKENGIRMIYGMMNYENVILVRYHSNSNYIGIDHRLVYIHIRKLQTFEKEGDKMKYTPGPWRDYWGEANDGKQIFQIHKENDSTKIMQGSKSDTDTSLKELEADVKLIAAAPELLEIAIEIEKIVKQGKIVNSLDADSNENLETITRLRKIINKAKGELNELHSK